MGVRHGGQPVEGGRQLARGFIDVDPACLLDQDTPFRSADDQIQREKSPERIVEWLRQVHAAFDRFFQKGKCAPPGFRALRIPDNPSVTLALANCAPVQAESPFAADALAVIPAGSVTSVLTGSVSVIPSEFSSPSLGRFMRNAKPLEPKAEVVVGAANTEGENGTAPQPRGGRVPARIERWDARGLEVARVKFGVDGHRGHSGNSADGRKGEEWQARGISRNWRAFPFGSFCASLGIVTRVGRGPPNRRFFDRIRCTLPKGTCRWVEIKAPVALFGLATRHFAGR